MCCPRVSGKQRKRRGGVRTRFQREEEDESLPKEQLLVGWDIEGVLVQAQVILLPSNKKQTEMKRREREIETKATEVAQGPDTLCCGAHEELKHRGSERHEKKGRGGKRDLARLHGPGNISMHHLHLVKAILEGIDAQEGGGFRPACEEPKNEEGNE